MDQINNINQDQDRQWHYPYFKLIEKEEEEENATIPTVDEQRKLHLYCYCGNSKDELIYNRLDTCKSRDNSMNDYIYNDLCQKWFEYANIGLLTNREVL